MTPAERSALIQRYADGPALVRAALAAVPEPVRTWRPAPGKWTVHEIIVHCADSETNAHMRLRYLLAEEQPVIAGYNQDRWASVLDYHSRPLEPALATIEAVRANTVPLLRSLPESAWARRGMHTESGPYTTETWLDTYSQHLEVHARQIARNLAAYR